MKSIIRVWGTLFIALVLFTISSPAQPPLPPLPPGVSGGGGGGHSHGDSAPGVPGGGSGSGTNDGGVTFSPPIYDTNAFYLEALQFGTNAYNADSNSLTLLLHNTIADIAYQIWSTTNLQGSNTIWVVEQNLIGSEITNFTPATIPLTGDPQKYFKAMAYTLDSDGDGLPDWWEQKYFGSLGIDPYGDTAGDGWSNLQKYQLGMNPGTFYTPPAVSGITVTLNTNGNVVLSWMPAANLPTNGAGAVTGYTITFDGTTYTTGTNQTNYVISGDGLVADYLTDPADNPFLPTPSLTVNYANADSSAATPSLLNTNFGVETYIVRGPGGHLNLVASSIPQNVVAIRVFAYTPSADSGHGYVDYPIGTAYSGSATRWDLPTNYFFDVPVSNFTNGVYVFSNAELPLYHWFYLLTLPVISGGSLAQPPPDQSYQLFNTFFVNIPFLDGTTQIHQNLTFLLQAATENNPLNFAMTNSFSLGYQTFPTSYGYAGFHEYSDPAFVYANNNQGILNEFAPFEENYAYRNFVFATSAVSTNGSINTGLTVVDGQVVLSSNPTNLFDEYAFVAAGNSNPPSAILSGWQWTYYSGQLGLAEIGMYEDVELISTNYYTNYVISNGQANLFGLPCQSVEAAYADSNNMLTFATIITNSPLSITTTNPYNFFPATTVPELQTNSVYFFGRPGVDPLPGNPAFNVTNSTPLMIAGLGQPFYTSAWARQSILNGYTDKYAYLEQYFDKAYLADTNGNITTNQTGVLSEYGDFFPTDPGLALLTTKPNPYSTPGTNQVHVIALCADADHDGVINMKYSGPDAITPSRIFQFWVNNNYDRWHTVDVTDSEQDDLLVADCPYTIDHDTPDCEYRNVFGNREIPSTRDLEDFARLWIVGVSNCLSALPSGSTVTLSWGDVDSPNTNNPTIDLFAAADADGGMGYLTNSTIATNQIDPTISPYIGRLGPGQSIQLNACEFGNCWRGDHFIWCGVARGNGALTLTIADASSNVLAQTVMCIQLKDIKEMYERWTVGDEPKIAPTNTAHLAAEDLPFGVTPFQYGPPSGTNTPYILHVHGSNMERWEKDRYAETMYKRLYWQGYQGRFGSFRWPTAYNFSLADIPQSAGFFGKIEYTAWQSAAGLKSFLTQLNAEYLGSVYLTSHSMGTVVCGEALRQSTNGNVVAVYASFQGALAAHTYDSNAPTRYLGIYDQGEENAYAHYWTTNNPPYFYGVGGAAKYVNFFNTNDFVLQYWNNNQLDKPIGYLSYAYSNSVGSGTYYYTNALDYTVTLDFPTNAYQLFAFCVPARCNCIGEQADIGGAFTTSAQVDLLADPFDFGNEHIGHSAEFRSDNMSRSVFWDQVLRQMNLKQ